MQLTDKRELEDLVVRLSYKFNDMSILEQALVHRSFLNEKMDQNIKNNERLEFLGDAVLSAAISHILIETFPSQHGVKLAATRCEGGVTMARVNFVMAIELGR